MKPLGEKKERSCPFCDKTLDKCECGIMEYHDTCGEEHLFGGENP